ncbi:heptaprenyl diphosphate synthase component 1 [Alicyclobacillus sp. SO9]|uniref:heptaprenyl diphosphate synthase component 1 n=1 Tax=Alicyclobacillus sp. SO9 TaxID=2665646 RepID=UPI0018E7F045|nr:heptaprenyl diphosphate synthase component 1 [Alicyclobacillus sp. SO9]
MVRIEADSVLYEDVNQRVQRYLFNPYLEARDVKPEASKFHFEVGAAILKVSGVKQDRAQEILEAVLLLQEGLSIHDEIDNQAERIRQLFVLTGDFSSSQYYYVLSHLGDTELLYDLCDAVVRINEAKMTLLDLSSDALFEDRANLYEIVEGELLYVLANHFLQKPEQWQSQIQSLVEAHILKEMPQMSGVRLQRSHGKDWLTEVMNRLLTVQANTFLEPISSFFIDYLQSIQQNFEHHFSLSEGNS